MNGGTKGRGRIPARREGKENGSKNGCFNLKDKMEWNGMMLLVVPL